jgi:N-acetylneuraminic acid mutarotase
LRGKKPSNILIAMGLILLLIYLSPEHLMNVPSVNSQTEIVSFAYISLSAETAEVGQSVNVEMWIEPAPPTRNDNIQGTLKVMRPDGIIDSFYCHIHSQNGTLIWSYVPNQVGNFSFQFIYPGDSYANGTITYQSASSPLVTLTVQGTARPQMETPAGSWIQKTSMSQARRGLGVALVNNRLYAIGGTTSESHSTQAILDGSPRVNEEYDPVTDTWTLKTPIPSSRYNFAIAACQNKIYVIGGVVGTKKIEGQFLDILVLTNLTQVYDPATDNWETKAPMPAKSEGLTANVVNDKIYLMSGKTVFIYNPDEDFWTTKELAMDTTDYAFSAVVDDRIYLLSESSKPLAIYDVVNDSWSQGTPAPAVSIYGSAVATTGVMAPKRVYVLGVEPYVSSLHESMDADSRRVTYSYDVESDSWLADVTMPTYRYDFGVAVINDTVFVIGGCTLDDTKSSGVTMSALTDQYIPAKYGTVPPIVRVISPETKTYSTANVSLTFTVNKPVNWMSYSLDGQSNITLTEKALNLTGLTNGSHTLTLYATDTDGNTGASETISFTITKEDETPIAQDDETPTSWTTTAIVIAVAAVAAAGAAILLYLTKLRKKPTNERTY